MSKFVHLIAVFVLVTLPFSQGRANPAQLDNSIKLQMELSLAARDLNTLNSKTESQASQGRLSNEFGLAGERKSPSRALFLSLLVPGAGQFYTESKTKAGIFVSSEASIWVGFFTFRAIGTWKKQDYENLAVDHAGINPDGKDEDYYTRLTYYDNLDQYNQLTRLYNGPQAPIYPATDYWNWQWDSQNSRMDYRDLRNQSKTAFRRSLFMVGLAALNRVVSALDAFRGAKKFNSKKASEPEQIGFKPEVRLFGSNRKIALTAFKSFY